MTLNPHKTATEYAASFQELSQVVHHAGLINRRYWFYWLRITGWILALALLATTVIVLGPTWYQLIPAALTGIVLAQLGFLSHEAAHRQIFASRAWNEWGARVMAGLLVGLSYSWWMAKHNSHHGHPNQLGKDPDIDSRVLAFTPEATDQRTGLRATLAKYQGIYFGPLLLLEGLNLHVKSLTTLLTSRTVPHRPTELALVLTRHTVYLLFIFTVLPWGLAASFLGVQVGVFGLHLGGAFALNHIGMPTVAAHARIDFLRRQVNMSRNIQDSPPVRFLMGGLQFQIEHHLFPVAPRPSHPALQRIVREHCEKDNITYTQRTLTEATTSVVSYLNQVGLKNRDPYICPLVQRFRG